jgi:hypothetical protein
MQAGSVVFGRNTAILSRTRRIWWRRAYVEVMNAKSLAISLALLVAGGPLRSAELSPGVKPMPRPSQPGSPPSWNVPPSSDLSPDAGPPFDLDFAGGRPKDLVVAIQRATGHPLNVIIAADDAEVTLPPVKVHDVSLGDLFSSLEIASRRQVAQVTGTYFDNANRPSRSQYSFVNTSYGFEKRGNVWVFHVDKPVAPPRDAQLPPERVARFYQLGPFLEHGYTVEDITTAIQTAWELTPNAGPPATLKFHKETKLLIGVGNTAQLQTIEDALKALRPSESTGKQPRGTNAAPSSAKERP